MMAKSFFEKDLWDNVPKAWLQIPGATAVAVQCWTSAISAHSKESSAALSAVQALSGKPKIWGNAAFVRVTKAFKVADSIVTCSFPTSDGQFKGENFDRDISIGNYLLLMGLIREEADRPLFDDFVQQARGVLTASFGHDACHSRMYDQLHSMVKIGEFEFSSGPVTAHLGPKKWAAFDQAFFEKIKDAALPDAAPELAARIKLAFDFWARAANERDQTIRFAMMWIALETAAGGRGPVQDYLNGLSANSGPVAKRYVDLRNALFHHGKSPAIEYVEDERFMAAALIDLIGKHVTIAAQPGFLEMLDKQIAKANSK